MEIFPFYKSNTGPIFHPLPLLYSFLQSAAKGENMTRRTVIKPTGVHQPAAPYSHAMITSPGKSISISGQVPVDENGQVVSTDDFEAQVDQVFANIGRILEAAGASFW